MKILINKEDGTFEVALTTMEKVWTVKFGEMKFPLKKISKIRYAPAEADYWLIPGFKVGLAAPKVATVAHFYHFSEPKDFYVYYGDVKQTLCIEFADYEYGKLYLQVADEEDVRTLYQQLEEAAEI